MIRSAIPSRAKRETFSRLLLPVLLSLTLSSVALAQSSGKSAAQDTKSTSSKSEKKNQSKSDAKTSDTKTTSKTAKSKEEKQGKKVASLGDGKPVLLESYHDWSAYMAQGKEKTCYALASPKERAPSSLKRDQAYVFISNRPSENVRNEVSIIMGFPMKDNSAAKAEIGNASYDLIAKGTNAWVKNPAQETQFIDAMKKGAKLTVKAASSKGSQTTDSYSLAGLSQALDRVQKECQ
jgi:flagellum-specific peptidoglycan hydrolase FlgJ